VKWVQGVKRSMGYRYITVVAELMLKRVVCSVPTATMCSTPYNDVLIGIAFAGELLCTMLIKSKRAVNPMVPNLF